MLETVRLEDVLTFNRAPVRVERHESYPNLGIYSFGRGPFQKPPIEGDATSAQTLYRVRAGQFIYSRLFAFEGAFAVVPDEMDGYFVSNEYPTFDVDGGRLLTEYLRIAMARAAVWQELAGMTVGMGHRRQRLHPDALLAHEILLPPLDEQARTVEVVAAVDDAARRYAEERDAALGLLGAARESWFSGLEPARLSDLLDRIEAGKSPKAFDRPPVEGERGVLKVSAIRAGEFRPHEAKALPETIAFPEKARVQDGDVLISRANTRLLVGAACRVNGSFPNLFLCDKTLRLVPNDMIDADFLIQTLATSIAREQIEEAATGTSDSMKNISQAVILNLDVPFIEDIASQRELAGQLLEIQRAAAGAQRLLEQTQVIRMTLVEALFTGERRISETLAA
jgi:type I restriction enzyme, S subunit